MNKIRLILVGIIYITCTIICQCYVNKNNNKTESTTTYSSADTTGITENNCQNFTKPFTEHYSHSSHSSTKVHNSKKIDFDSNLAIWQNLEAISHGDGVTISTTECNREVCGFNISKREIKLSYGADEKKIKEIYDTICVYFCGDKNNKLEENQLFRLEINNSPVQPIDREWLANNADYYIKNPLNTSLYPLVCFKLPNEIRSSDNKTITEVQFVFWRTRIAMLKLKAWVVDL